MPAVAAGIGVSNPSRQNVLLGMSRVAKDYHRAVYPAAGPGGAGSTAAGRVAGPPGEAGALLVEAPGGVGADGKTGLASG